MREFVGRTYELSLFSSVLARETPARIINVTGIGGVGKSTLVEEFAKLARGQHICVGLVNARRLTDPNDVHNYPWVVEALISLEQALRDNGCGLPSLRARLDRYRDLHEQLSSRFAGQEGAAVGAILQVGVSAIRAGATVFPVAKPLNAVLTPELVNRVSQAIGSYRRPADRRLLSQPVEELTSLAMESLNARIRQDDRRMVLIFDEFELIPLAVDQWLRQCFSQVFGALDERVVLVLSGRIGVSQDWTARGQGGTSSEISNIQLKEFGSEEVTEYLSKAIPNFKENMAWRIASTLDPSYRLPLALRLLVNDPEYLVDTVRQHGRLGLLNEDIVNRLLDDRYTTPAQRSTALAVAVARRFDNSIISAIQPDLDKETARSQMDWLTHQHFINPHAVAYSYYDLVRGIFLRYLDNADRPRLEEIHARLCYHYERLLAQGTQSARMRNLAVEMAYHYLSTSADNILAEALKLLFKFLPAAYEYGISWSRMLGQIVYERHDLVAADKRQLDRLASVLKQTWRLSAPSETSASSRAADPALNILFTSSFDDSLPEVTGNDAELWLTYFECRLKSVTGDTSEIGEALRELLRVWRAVGDLMASGLDESLLAFRVASDIADIYTRRGDLSGALEYNRHAISIAETDGSPIREAFALYQLSNNLKRGGRYRDALDSLSRAINLVRQNPNGTQKYYLGRFLLDRGVTLTYLADTQAAEDSFEASRACLADISSVAYAELSHRLGWLKRVRGDLKGSLADHETAIKLFQEIDTDLRLMGKPSHVTYSLAKVLHSIGNVYVEMCRHVEALANFDEALQLFSRQGGIRHEAIVLKDRAWSRFVVHGAAAAEDDLIRAITDLGPQSTERERPAVNSTTHLAEAWLMLSLIRSLTDRLEEASDAVNRVEELVRGDENRPLAYRLRLQESLNSALDRQEGTAISLSSAVRDDALEGPQHWMLAARATLIEAAVALIEGNNANQRAQLAVAIEWARRWNEFGPAVIEELWIKVADVVKLIKRDPPNDRARRRYHLELMDSSDEIIDVYDEQGRALGQASSRLAHSIGLWHRSFHCWVVRLGEHSTKKILLQRRGPLARNFPNYFDMSAAGHYRAGEGIEGGIRECEEELGITATADELQLIAKRVINEILPSGMINREFQDIYLLCGNGPAELYHPGYPEVSAVVECSLDDLLAVVTDTTESVPFTGICVEKQASQRIAFDGNISRQELIAEARAYHQQVFRLISSEMDGPREGPRADGEHSTIQLADGSKWTQLT
jgi:tetratricopeptide (TPR) repeat protein